MSQPLRDLKRVAASSGLYAAGELARRGLAFLLLPVYTRFLDRAEYGVLELLSALTGVLFAALLLGLPSAVNKSFHTDCRDRRERSRLLATALALDLPVLVAIGGALWVFAEPAGRLVVGRAGYALELRLVVATAVVSSLMAIVLASFRARERAGVFVALSLAQFVPAMALNVLLVVRFEMGVLGVLWGNLVSAVLALVLGLVVARRDAALAVERRLVRPLLRFGLLLVPVMLASWVIDASDRYVLRLYRDLEEIAVYGVGYKIAMVLQMAVVWPFQLAWPAVSFSIARRDDHRETYARVLTWLVAVLVWGFLVLALGSRAGLAALAGAGYADAYRYVAPVALAYLANGVHYALSPGVHLGGKTRYLAAIAGAAAALNLGLNFLFVPRWGAAGAAWSTTATFVAIAVATAWVAQRAHPVVYEHRRLGKLAAAGAAVYALAVGFAPAGLVPALAWQLGLAVAGFPAALWALGFLRPQERAALGRLLGRFRGAEEENPP